MAHTPTENYETLARWADLSNVDAHLISSGSAGLSSATLVRQLLAAAILDSREDTLAGYTLAHSLDDLWPVLDGLLDKSLALLATFSNHGIAVAETLTRALDSDAPATPIAMACARMAEALAQTNSVPEAEVAEISALVQQDQQAAFIGLLLPVKAISRVFRSSSESHQVQRLEHLAVLVLE